MFSVTCNPEVMGFQRSGHIQSTVKCHGTKFKLYLKPDDSEGTSGAGITIGSFMSVSITIILGMCENACEHKFRGCRELQ